MVIGVSGKIASGKSEVLRILESAEYYCIDADTIVHTLYRPGGEGAKTVSNLFGEQYLLADGEVDRNRLRDLVFNYYDSLKMLNHAIHPIVCKHVKKKLEELHTIGYDKVAIEAVYFDQGLMGDLVDKIIWVERSTDKIIEHLIQKRNFQKELAEKVVNLVVKPDVEFTEIENNSDLQSLEKKVLEFIESIE